MDIERPHRTTSTPTTTSELFICFTSRLSKSSSMRLSSRSILSPGRAGTSVDNKSLHSQSHSLSTSLSRRLRHNGSLRGAQSPAMFPSSKKNKGSSGFADNPEPSSPKVTCIGQVRVKTKKQGKKMKMRACRSKRLSGGGGSGGGGGGGEASFRRIEHSHSHEGGQQQGSQECGLNHRNQRWVHLPLTICEALRTFGSEFSCLFPCKSSCFSSGSFCGGGDKEEKKENPSSPNSCAVFRWLVSVHEGEGGGDGRRDIELVVGGAEEEVVEVERRENMMMERECSRRRSIFDDMEFDDLFTKNDNVSEIVDNIRNDNVEDDDEGGRVSVCVPPKNALLLMRCRSDPMKMASLSRKLWEVSLPLDDDDVKVEGGDEEEEEVENEEKTEKIGDETEEFDEVEEEKIDEIGEKMEDFGEGSEEIDEFFTEFDDLPGFIGDDEEQEEEKTEEKQSVVNMGEEECEVFEENQLIEDENRCSLETILVEEEVEHCEIEQDLVINSEENQQVVNLEEVEEEKESVELVESNDLSTVEQEETVERGESSDISTITATTSSTLNSSEESTAESKERENEEQQQEEEKEKEKDPVEEQEETTVRKSIEGENKKKILPDCLLLMMCEPKVSMEVSKETWVCSTDFIRWLPERHPKKVANKTDGSGDSTTKKNKPAAVAAMPPPYSVQHFEQVAHQPPIQPARSSISFPAGGGSVANLIEQKLVKGGGGGVYEPFVLTRCKSAPLRSAAKNLPPEMACSLWGRENGRKLEPHRPATFGVGAAGVGF